MLALHGTRDSAHEVFAGYLLRLLAQELGEWEQPEKGPWGQPGQCHGRLCHQPLGHRCCHHFTPWLAPSACPPRQARAAPSSHALLPACRS